MADTQVRMSNHIHEKVKINSWKEKCKYKRDLWGSTYKIHRSRSSRRNTKGNAYRGNIE